MSVGKLTGPKKAAILLLALGEDAAADVLKNKSFYMTQT